MTPAIQQLFNDINGLIPQSLRHIPGQREGLVIRMAPTGVYLSHVDIMGTPKNFTDVHRNWMRTSLLKKFPHIDASAILARGSESIRRYNSIEGRLAMAQENAKSGKVIAIESLDMNARIPRPVIPAGQMSAAEPGRIPRGVTWVQLDPAPPKRVIIFSDLPMDDKLFKKKIIPDEIFVSYPVSDEEMKAIKSAAPPKTFTRFDKIPAADKLARDIKIVCGDINKELAQEDMVKHFEKTMRGLVAASEKIFKEFGITPTGKVTAIAGDSYLHSAEAHIADATYASMRRSSAEGTKISMLAEFTADAADGTLKPTKLEPYFSKKAARAATRLGLSMVAVATALEDILKSLPKVPKKH